MTKQKTTKKTLLTSVLSLVLCMAMLIGTTFAWFTDSVASGKNQIVAGNLDVELEYSTDLKNWETVSGAENLFKPDALWEPGHAEVVYLKVSNKGTLALKYQFNMNVVSETSATSVEGNTFKLSDYLMYGVIEDVESTYEKRDDAIAAVSAPAKLADYSAAGQLEAGETKDDVPSDVVALVVYMPTSVGNEANYRGEAPVINLGVNLVATQLMNESDSFGNDYDEDATYYEAWDGSTDTDIAVVDGVYQVTSAAEFAGFAQIVNGGKKNINAVLTTSVNLAGRDWTPIVTDINQSGYSGTFDGQGNTIYNLKTENMISYGCGGVFGYVTGTIKNLNVNGAYVRSSYDAGAVAGYAYGDIINCYATDCTVIANQAGGITGLIASADVKNCSVDNCKVIGANGAGGLVGITMDKNTNVVNNSVKNTTIISKSANEEVYWHAATGDSSVADNTLEGNTVTSLGTKPSIVSNADELIALGGTNVEGTIVFVADVDLDGAEVKTIGAAYGKELMVLGLGHTISNAVAVTGQQNGMTNNSLFYAFTNSTLKISDLNIENVTVAADSVYATGAAVVVGYADGGSTVVLDNIDVVNSKVNNTAENAAIYVGYTTGTVELIDCDITSNCSVEGVEVNKTGAYIGTANTAGCTVTITNCTNGTDVKAIGRNYNGNATIIIDGDKKTEFDIMY